jgi:hypothetical protein
MPLVDRDNHFEFGENWRVYAKTIDSARLQGAILGFRKLFPDGLSNKTFLDWLRFRPPFASRALAAGDGAIGRRREPA